MLENIICNSLFEDDEESWWDEESSYEKEWRNKPIIGSDKFTKFLIENCIYEKFIDAITIDIKKREGGEVTIERINDRIGQDIIIGALFEWNNTEDGHDFWLGISIKWNDIKKK